MRRLEKRRAITLALLFLVLLLPLQASSVAIVDADDLNQAPLLQAVEVLHAGDPAAARALLSEYIVRFPDDPVGPLLRMKVSWWGILEGRDVTQDLQTPLEEDFQLLQGICDRRLDADPDDVRTLYALGEAWCAMGRLEGLRGHAWSTLRHHQKGTPYLEKAIDLQPELVEPLVSLGVFHYYASRAPGFLRFVARVFRVKADRPRGLQSLRQASSTPGVQQAEAAFFLLEVLTNVEDEYIEALPLALKFHARYPDNIGFRIPLSAAQIAWGRPEAAMALMRVGAEQWDDHETVSSRFFEARLLGMTGHATESAALLESFTPSDLASITWLPAWHPYYLGSAYDQLGRQQDAQVEYRNTVAAHKVADSHGYAERALGRHRSTLDLVVSKATAALCWGDSIDETVLELRQQLQTPQQAEQLKRAEANYLLGCLELERGEYAAAAKVLKVAIEIETDQEAWLIARPRARLLQALLWAGQFEEAQEYARRFAEISEEWGSNQHLRMLVQTALHPEAHVVSFEHGMTPASNRSEAFLLRDIGFTSVVLVRDDGRRQRSHAMKLRDGFWQVKLPLPAGDHSYRFELDGGVTTPDPANLEVNSLRGETWSLRHVRPVES